MLSFVPAVYYMAYFYLIHIHKYLSVSVILSKLSLIFMSDYQELDRDYQNISMWLH